jgi:glutamate racemase
VLGFLLFSCRTGWCAGNEDQDSTILYQDEITIVITDSGLGGLDVMDDISKKLKYAGYYKQVNLIFVNALFDADRGYNALNTREEKIDILNSVLQGIDKKFTPDIILIGCNTLSVLFEETTFFQESDTPVAGIIKPGIEIISERLSRNNKSVVIITGTETTISEGSHREALLEKGFSEEQIITQACPELQSYIEEDPYGEDTEMLISYYVEEALAQLSKEDTPLYLSLNCSHFGYSEELWQQAFDAAGAELLEILNPNRRMGDLLIPERNKNRFEKTKIIYSVHSKVVIKNMESIHDLFRDSSPEIAAALKDYKLDSLLF